MTTPAKERTEEERAEMIAVALTVSDSTPAPRIQAAALIA
jgi:hypothetical protein